MQPLCQYRQFEQIASSGVARFAALEFATAESFTLNVRKLAKKDERALFNCVRVLLVSKSQGRSFTLFCWPNTKDQIFYGETTHVYDLSGTDDTYLFFGSCLRIRRWQRARVSISFSG